MNSNADLADNLHVGIVQTTLNASIAWTSVSGPRMIAAQDSYVWHEICRALRAFVDGSQKPRIILLPELSLPVTRFVDFERMVGSLNVIAIVGVDYTLDYIKLEARNEGIVFVPKNFWKSRKSSTCVRIRFGKTHAAPAELKKLQDCTPPWAFVGDAKIYVFDCAELGKVGVAVCYDFMDIERALIYRGKIHHLFVLAYNKDVGMFRSLAESLSRTLFCNVIVCNTGFYGGSITMAPFYEAYRRTIYSHGGAGLFTSQVVELHVKDLEQARQNPHSLLSKEKRIFKDPPPGLIENL